MRLWVKSAALDVCQSLPVFRDKRTSSGPVGTSQKCHNPKRRLATRGLLNLRSQRIPKSKQLSGRGLITAERGLNENKL